MLQWDLRHGKQPDRRHDGGGLGGQQNSGRRRYLGQSRSLGLTETEGEVPPGVPVHVPWYLPGSSRHKGGGKLGCGMWQRSLTASHTKLRQ